MENTNNFVIDDGLKTYTFSNLKKEVFAEFAFNPTDTSIIERYDKVVETFNGIELKGESEDEVKEYIQSLSKTFKEQFDYLLNRDVSSSLFRVYSPITIFANGDFFAEIILERMGAAIEKEMDVRLKRKAKKIAKYTDKYKKKFHN